MTTSRRESFALGATALVMAGLAVAVIVVASLVHSHFAPREAFCDATQTASANCGLDMFLSQASAVVRVLAIIVLVFLGVIALIALMSGAVGDTPASSAAQPRPDEDRRTHPRLVVDVPPDPPRLDVQGLPRSRTAAPDATPQRAATVERLVREGRLHPADAAVLLMDGRVDDDAWALVRPLLG